MCRPAAPPSRNAGLTLVEICLVLALLVVIGAFSYPALQGTFARAALTGGAAIVRGGLAKARLNAMESGKTQVFRCEPKGARFQVVPLEQLALPENAGPGAEDADTEHAAEDILRLRLARLPDRVIFAAADVAASNQATALFGESKDEAWSAPIVFSPDGTSTDASLVLQNDQGHTIRITLRGLTGVATVGEVGREAVP